MAVATLGSRRLIDLGLAALAALGVTLLVRPYAVGWLVDPVGLAFAGSAALCWAGYILLTKRVGAAFPGLQGLTISLAVAALAVTPLGLAGISAWPQPSQVAAVGLAILAPILPCGLEMIALRRMSARPFGILMSLEPAIGVAIGYILLHQQPNDAQLLGVLCVIAASAGAVMATARPRSVGRGPARRAAPSGDVEVRKGFATIGSPYTRSISIMTSRSSSGAAIVAVPTMQPTRRSPIRVAMRRDPAGYSIVLLEGSVEGLDPLRLAIEQLPTARRLVGEGLDTIARRLEAYRGEDSLVLAEADGLRLSAMLVGGETVIALAAEDLGQAVAVPAAQGAELYLTLRAAERCLVAARDCTARG